MKEQKQSGIFRIGRGHGTESEASDCESSHALETGSQKIRGKRNGKGSNTIVFGLRKEDENRMVVRTV